MPRPMKTSDLSTATARKRLKPRAKPYWRSIATGRHLGYRRLSLRPGAWVARLYLGEGRYGEKALGSADDALKVSTPNKGVVLSFREAQDAAVEWFAEQDDSDGHRGPHTVEQAMNAYIAFLEAHRKSARHVSYSVHAHIIPALGALDVSALTAPRIRAWHEQLAEAPIRLRTKPGENQRLRKPQTSDERRKRKATANRVLSILKAGLSRAYEDGLVSSHDAWRRVKSFRGVEEPRIRYLDTDEALRLLNACPTDFHFLVEGALHTGARYGELTRLLVSDYKPEAKALALHETKGNKARTVYLTPAGVAFFDGVTAGRQSQEVVFLRDDGEPWRQSQQQRRMQDACKVAKIRPAIGFHILRHTYASLYLQAGGSLVSLARQLGHSTTRMTEKHYGHLSDAWRAEEARKHAPQITSERANVYRIRRVSRPT